MEVGRLGDGPEVARLFRLRLPATGSTAYRVYRIPRYFTRGIAG